MTGEQCYFTHTTAVNFTFDAAKRHSRNMFFKFNVKTKMKGEVGVGHKTKIIKLLYFDLFNLLDKMYFEKAGSFKLIKGS